jgi:beta-mannosidase
MLLNGEWNCKGLGPDGEELFLSANVPGCVHTDLLKNSPINDIFYRDNAESVQWIERWDFTYTKTFFVDYLEENAFIIFEGLDTYCDIYLNGFKIGSADNMFIPHEYCVDNIIHQGENTLEVRCFHLGALVYPPHSMHLWMGLGRPVCDNGDIQRCKT